MRVICFMIVNKITPRYDVCILKNKKEMYP